jgi:putative integral membrane protein (TIGR02587 family)
MIAFSHERSPSASLREYGRGLAGGLMFAMPLLFTMEVWYAGFLLQPPRIIGYVVSTFVLLLFYNRFVGLRKDASMIEVAIDSIEEMGLGVMVAALVLWLSGLIDATMTIHEIAGKIIVEAMTVAIGVSVGTAQLGASGGGDEGFSGEDELSHQTYLPQVAIALCGAALFAANIAPTDEIKTIAREILPLGLLLLSLFSLLLITLVLHFTEFRGASGYVLSDSWLMKLRGVVTTYAVALFASASALWFFGAFDGQPIDLAIAETVVLGVPAVLGASAGRLLLQTADSN